MPGTLAIPILFLKKMALSIIRILNGFLLDVLNAKELMQKL
jgi:hypothetical protein